LAKTDVYRQVAELHIANIDQGFLATLGVGFLSLMYRAIDEANDTVLLFEERGDRVIGFVAGGIGMATIYKRMVHSPFRLGFALLPVFLRPRSLFRIFEILRYSRRKGSQNSGLPIAELMSIAVARDYRGQQIAERLYRRLCDHFETVGVLSFKITVGNSLEPAHRFYRRMGAEPAGSIEVHRGEQSIVYVHKLRR
jgi:ribosomal protein S18 acetylase RimI-like enzyme